MSMEMQVIDYLAKWAHFLFGITWIGLLYYFNFVQTEYFKEADPKARTDAFTKLAPRALWWFRWGAMFTLISGIIMLGIRGATLTVDLTLGSVIAILMFLNVWLIIWPNQKILIASNAQIKDGGEALPEAAAAAPKAALASRTNTLFSIPMLYFMGSSSAGLHNGMLMSGDNTTGLVITLIIVGALELNAIFGKQGVMTTIKGVITSGFVLWAVLLGVLMLTKERAAVAEAPMVEPMAEAAAAPDMPPAAGEPASIMADAEAEAPMAESPAEAEMAEGAAEADAGDAADEADAGSAETEADAGDAEAEADADGAAGDAGAEAGAEEGAAS